MVAATLVVVIIVGVAVSGAWVKAGIDGVTKTTRVPFERLFRRGDSAGDVEEVAARVASSLARYSLFRNRLYRPTSL